MLTSALNSLLATDISIQHSFTKKEPELIKVKLAVMKTAFSSSNRFYPRRKMSAQN